MKDGPFWDYDESYDGLSLSAEKYTHENTLHVSKDLQNLSINPLGIPVPNIRIPV